MEIETLYKQIEFVLENNHDARNSDNLLHKIILKTFYPGKLYSVSGKAAILLEDFEDLPNRETIKRVRAKIQNTDQRFVPTDWKVAQGRHWKEEDWQRALGYHIFQDQLL